MKTWQEEYTELIISITDEKFLDMRRNFIEEGLESEENAKILTKFIHDNKIDCRNCYEDDERYKDYEKLLDKIVEIGQWEEVNEGYKINN